MPSILIVKTSSIGDVIQALPVLEYLKERFAQVTIDWVVERPSRALLEAHPLVDGVICLDSRGWRRSWQSAATYREVRQFYKQLRRSPYDLLFDLQGNGKSALITWLSRAKVKVGFGRKTVREQINVLATHLRYEMPHEGNVRLRLLALVQAHFGEARAFVPRGVHLTLTARESERLQHLLACCPADRFRLMVSPWSTWPNKELSEETLAGLLRLAVQQGSYLLLIYGTTREKERCDQLHRLFPAASMVVGDLTHPLWQALMWRMGGVLAVDSAALHLCATTDRPSFSLFGPSAASVFKPIGEGHGAMQGPCPYGQVFVKQCPHLRTCKSAPCIKEISGIEIPFSKWIAACQSAGGFPRDGSPRGFLPSPLCES